MNFYDMYHLLNEGYYVGSLYQAIVDQGHDPRMVKAILKDLIPSVLDQKQQMSYARIKSEDRGRFPLTHEQYFSVYGRAREKLQNNAQEVKIGKFHAQNPHLGKGQAKGIYLDRQGMQSQLQHASVSPQVPQQNLDVW